MKNEILNWLRSGQNYDDGVALYAKYGHNKTVLKNFLRKETKDRKAKLAYKLVVKCAGFPDSYINMPLSKLPQPSPEALEGRKPTHEPRSEALEDRNLSANSQQLIAKSYKGQIPFKDLPEEVQLMIVQRSTLEKKRTGAHQALDKVPKPNTEENKSKRVAICKEVDKYTGEINTLNTKIKYYEDNGKLPEEKTPGIIESSLLKLKQTLMNLKSQRSKARAKVFGNEKNDPIPEGPRKEAAKKKLEELEPKIEEIEKKLNA
jgi:hypothetical protein